MKKPLDAETYSEVETQRRVEAALRGARMAGHKPMKDIPKKRAAKPKATTKKA